LRAVGLSPGVDATGSPEEHMVLVVEDDDLTRAFLLDNLIADGFRAVGASGMGRGCARSRCVSREHPRSLLVREA
jgi:hypothetical protein